MRQIITLTFLSVVLSFCPALGQSSTETIEDCPRARLAYNLDSIQTKSALDSVYSLAAGRWRLARVELSGRLHPHRKLVEMTLDSSGKASIYEEGRLITVCQFSLSAPFAYIRFNLDEVGRNYFRLSQAPSGLFVGGFRVCKEKLVFYDNKSETTAFFFDPVR